MKDWCEAILANIALLPGHGPALPPGVSAAHAPAAAKGRRDAAQAANMGSTAPERLARYCLEFVRYRELEHFPWSAAEAEYFVLDFLQCRNAPPPGVSWAKVNTTQQLKNDASRIAAASTRAGWALPPYCGRQVAAWCDARGAKQKREHSTAHPIHLTRILRAEPNKRKEPTAWRTWAALVVMSLFCLRTGVLFHLYARMFIPYDGGYILVWRHVQKRARGDPESPEVLSSIGAVSAARHPLLREILADAHPDTTLFGDLDHEDLTRFVRAHIADVPADFDIRVYGVRVGADEEATTLQLPEDACRTLFWWKRSKPDMRSYYSGVNIRLWFAFSERRVRLRFVSLGVAGGFDGAAASAADLDWKTPVVHCGSMPDPPSYERVLTALRTASASFVVARRARAAANAERARRTLGRPTAPKANPVTEITEGYCNKCCCLIGEEEDATACLFCDELVCTDCHAYNTDWQCPVHLRNTK